MEVMRTVPHTGTCNVLVTFSWVSPIHWTMYTCT